MVKTIEELDTYPYSGHSVIIGASIHKWQDREYVLRIFSSKEGRAKKEYKKFIEAAIAQGHRPELVGGGLIRSQGGWSEVISMRKRQLDDNSDERILGSDEFVKKITAEAEEQQKRIITGDSVLNKLKERNDQKDMQRGRDKRGGN